MRTRKLISLVAMAAMVAGCSQEEFAPVGEKPSVDLGNRPTIGNVTLGMDAQTRMVIADGSSLALAWENGDQIGASIIDQPIQSAVSGKDFSGEGGTDFSSLTWTYSEYVAGVKKQIGGSGTNYSAQDAGLTAADFYTRVEYVSSNYPYTMNNGSFTTPANLVEGNYMFYAPYNEKQLMRERVNAVLPMVQDCTDAVMKSTKYQGEAAQVSSTALEQFYAGTMEGFEKAPVAVGYKFLAAPADGSLISPKVVMSHLYAYPMITIVNDFDGYFYGATNTSSSKTTATATMTIDSIQIYDATVTSNLFYTAPIKSSKIAVELAKDNEWDGARFTEGALTDELLDTKVQTYAGHVESTIQQPQLEAANSALTYQANHVTCRIEKELKNGEAYHFHAILPAADYEHNLKARVFVTIGEKRYVIVSATNSGNANEYKVSSAWADFAFQDVINGNQNCELVRGEHFPKAEIREDGSATKAFAGAMLTLNLANGTAFELKTIDTPTETNSGFKDNEDFINYLIDNVQRGVELTEESVLNNVARTKWKTYSTGITASAGNFAFATDTKCIIDAQLIKDLKQQTIVTESDGIKLTLKKTNLPIADDVKYTVSGNDYTFTTLDEDAVTYKITMSGVIFGDNGAELKSGINNIGTDSQGSPVTVELKVKSGETNAVAYLEGASGNATTVTVKDCTGISAIYVNANTVLNVEGACSSLIIANGGIINIKSNGALTNSKNEFSGSTVINNSSLRTINGTVADGVNVVAEFAASWPTTAIPAASKINKVTINTTEAGVQTIEQAQMDIFANLVNVNLTLGNNITSITSHNDVTLTNLKSITGNNINWNTTNNSGINVSHNGTSISNITPGTNVYFVDITE